jgi:signal transduction histidine kinase
MRRFAGDVLAERPIDLDFEASIDRPERDLAPDVRRQVYLIFKEAVNNVARHSACSRARIVFRVAGRSLSMLVSDDGRGFDASAAGAGHGLPSIRARAAALGGTAEIRAQPPDGSGSGTTVAVTIPLPR